MWNSRTLEKTSDRFVPAVPEFHIILSAKNADRMGNPDFGIAAYCSSCGRFPIFRARSDV
jgi:hypothetical protein